MKCDDCTMATDLRRYPVRVEIVVRITPRDGSKWARSHTLAENTRWWWGAHGWRVRRLLRDAERAVRQADFGWPHVGNLEVK